MPVLFRLLGTPALGRGEDLVGIAVPKVRCLLAVLLLDANRTVTLERLTGELWGEDPPRSAVANLRSYALTLRRAFTAAGVDPDRLATTPGGYLLRVEPGESDLDRWEEHAAAGVAALADGRHPEAARRLGQALSYWRGPALDGVGLGPALAARATALDELRTAHTEDLFEARLLAGEGTALMTPLREHVAAHPTRERAYDQLMRVLYAGGDAAAALAVYQRARTALAEGLGIEPGPRLRETHTAVLRRDPSLVRTTPAPEVVPRQLPPDLAVLVGRDGELAELRAGTSPVRNIHGPGGVGKSALAIRLAHALAGGFPDGQLYLDLRGSNPRLTPLHPDDVLGRFVRALGVPTDAVPQDPAEVAALYRTLLADRRMLILLDNAVDAAQVRPLLPGGADSLVLVTSRRALAALDGAAMLPLDVLLPDDAAELLARLAGGAVRDDPAAARTLAGLCGKLPLALRIAAARLAARPDWSASDLVERLVDERGRLDELHTDDMAVRSCFQASYRALDPTAARAFRMAGLARVPHLSTAAMAALLGVPGAVAASALDRLVEARLVEADQGRFRLHDLLRLYAAEQSAALDAPGARAAALQRLLVYYASTVRRAVGVVMGYHRPLHPELLPPRDAEVTPVETWEQAEAWLDAELPCVLAVAEQAGEAEQAGRRYPAQVIRVSSHYVLRRQSKEMERLATIAMRVRAADDHASEAIASNILGQVHARAGRYGEAREAMTRSLELWQSVGDLDGVATASNALGSRAHLMGDAAAAQRYYSISLQALRELGNEVLQPIVLNNLAELYCSQQRYDLGVACVRESLRLNHARPSPSLFVRLAALSPLAVLLTHQGDMRAALRAYRCAIEAARRLNDMRFLIDILLCRSETHLRMRRLDLADADAEQAARHARRVGDAGGDASALRQLGKIRAAVGDRAGAQRRWAEAATLFQQIRQRPDRFVESFLAGDDPALPHPP